MRWTGLQEELPDQGQVGWALPAQLAQAVPGQVMEGEDRAQAQARCPGGGLLPHPCLYPDHSAGWTVRPVLV